MSERTIYLTVSRDYDATPDVTYLDSWSGGPHVSVRIGGSGLYLDPDTARQLAADILAALPCPDCALGACTVDHAGVTG